MAKLVNKVKDNPKLEQRLLGDGQISLYLEYYLGRVSEPVIDDNGNPVLYESGKMKGTPKYKVKHIRRKEKLSLYLIATPKTPIDRNHNKETLQLAKQIRQEKEQELLESKEGYRLKKDRQINFLDYFQTYIDNYTKKDIRMMQIALQRFKDFLKDTPEYTKFSKNIRPEQMSKDMMLAFTEYLQSRSVGEGAKSIYQRFKKVVKYAIEHDVMTKNPCTGVIIKVDDQQLRKDVLSLEEEQALINTHYTGENPNIRRAFILCLYCGLRFCDVKDLTFANVDYANKLLKFEQNKTKGHSASSGVIIPLNDGLLRLIGEPTDGQNSDSLIFALPSYEMCLKALKRWVKRAGINKHISWHCARHSFATNLLSNGANIKTVASLLGHSGLKYTEKYTRAVDSLKQEAINSLPQFNVDNI
ncbi:site-specific recombinase phage integrase family [Prevotella sp. CAG:1124]|nr:site-specific recombinase phage integrase family [Prevotella sp. CAG:1124]